jgi:hypothetical protein
VQYVAQVSNRSADALMEAQLAEADRYAPYEYTKAAAYQDKAREQAALASWELSLDYGRRAEEFAQRARALARQRAQRRAGASDAGSPSAPAPAAPPNRPQEP